MSSSFMVSPYSWDIYDVEGWCARARLSPSTIRALLENEVDGPTLMTISKRELREELGISSLAARRYLWESIQNLRAEHEAVDLSAAVQSHEEEIYNFTISETADDGAGSATTSVDPFVVECLRSDAERQRQIVEDHLLALRMQKDMGIGQEVYEDAEFAQREQERLDQLLMQSEYDREIALEMAPSLGGQVPRTTRDANELPSLFNLSIQACAKNKVNVAKAFETGKVKPIPFRCNPNDAEFTDDDDNDDDDEDNNDAIRGMPSSEEYRKEKIKDLLSALPKLNRCDVCYEERRRGFSLPCNHNQCVDCMRGLFRASLKDTSLLPLQCCEIPIDMTCAHAILKPEDFQRLSLKMEEISAKKKMYCPTCGCFINLDLVDSSESHDLECSCGASLCTNCGTSAHPSLSCASNKAAQTGSNDALLGLAAEKGWKQCPSCATMIELRSGCNHMTCAHCRHEFCYRCLRSWNSRSGVCSSGKCALWDEDRLVEAGEARVRAEEAIRGIEFQGNERIDRLRRAFAGLQANEGCTHDWVRQNGYHGDCENCSFTMYAYAMVCRRQCGATVCYTCAHHRIPRRGMR